MCQTSCRDRNQEETLWFTFEPTQLSNRTQHLPTGLIYETSSCFLLVPLPGKAPLPRPGFQMPEPDGCSSYFFGLPIPEGVSFFYVYIQFEKRISTNTESIFVIYCSKLLELSALSLKTELQIYQVLMWPMLLSSALCFCGNEFAATAASDRCLYSSCHGKNKQ